MNKIVKSLFFLDIFSKKNATSVLLVILFILLFNLFGGKMSLTPPKIETSQQYFGDVKLGSSDADEIETQNAKAGLPSNESPENNKQAAITQEDSGTKNVNARTFPDNSQGGDTRQINDPQGNNSQNLVENNDQNNPAIQPKAEVQSNKKTLDEVLARIREKKNLTGEVN